MKDEQVPEKSSFFGLGSDLKPGVTSPTTSNQDQAFHLFN